VAEFGPLVFDCADDVLKFRAHAARFNHKPTDFLAQKALTVAGARLGQFRDDGAQARTHFEEALLNQMLYDLVRGIGMYFQIGGKRPDGRERLAREEFTADESFGSGEDNLIEDGLTGAKGNLQSCHMNTVTEGTEKIKRRFLAPRGLSPLVRFQINTGQESSSFSEWRMALPKL
jgi:hypothetical protein